MILFHTLSIRRRLPTSAFLFGVGKRAKKESVKYSRRRFADIILLI